VAVRDLVASFPPAAWVRHRVTEGAKGPREYELARVRVVEKRHRAPGPAGWLLALAFVKFVQRKWERPAGPRERAGDL